MDSVLTSSVPDNYNRNRHIKKKETLPVTPRHRFVLELHLAGYRVKNRGIYQGSDKADICTLTGYKEPTIYAILNRNEVIALRQQIMNNYDKEFEAQYQKVIDAVDTALDPTKPDTTRLQAAKLWGDFHKKFQKVEVNQNINVTAEDVVFQIMNGNYQDESS